MEDDWESLADAKIPPAAIPKPNLNKWDGEDEEDDVKESWEDDDDEEKKDAEKVETPVKTKPKKTLQQKIADKEKQKHEELARKLAEAEDENLTPEERLAEKLRLQKLAEENDLKLGLESLGLSSGGGGASTIDGRNPSTAEEFTELGDAISKKILQFKARDEFPNFVEEIVRNVCASMSSNNIRKVKTTVENLFLEKQKLEKGDKPKKGKGAKGKARLRVEGDNAQLDDYAPQYDDVYDPYDDFM